MTLITALSLASFIVVVTIIICGFFADSLYTKVIGAFLLWNTLLFHIAFQHGAQWQQKDTKEKFNLMPKQQIINK